MKILVVFETGEGQTRKIAKFVSDQLKHDGHAVTVIDTSDRMATISLDDAERVILAAPVHERRHPKNFEVAIGAAKDALSDLPTLMISVSLKAAFPDGIEEARDYLTEMKMRTGFEPTTEILVAGAVQSGSYDYFQRQIVQFVALEGHELDPSDGPHEFTDWDDLADQLQRFLTQ